MTYRESRRESPKAQAEGRRDPSLIRCKISPVTPFTLTIHEDSPLGEGGEDVVGGGEAEEEEEPERWAKASEEKASRGTHKKPSESTAMPPGSPYTDSSA